MINPIIILVSPQMGENIGAAARAMKNFGARDLRIVAPRDGWPNSRAEAMAVGAVDIIHNAKLYDNIQDSITDLEYLYATTAKSRAMNKNCVSLKGFRSDSPKASSVGVMFGRESSGLANEEIALANEIITIDTTEFSSLNLAQAVGLVCYELFSSDLIRGSLETARSSLALSPKKVSGNELCTKGELQHFFNHLFSELESTRFFRTTERVGYMKQSIMNIFNRVDKLSHNELQTLRGVVAALASSNTESQN